PSLHYFFTQIRAYIRYIEMFFVSYDLNADNLQFGFSSNIFEFKVLFSLAINFAMISFSLFFIRSRPYIAFGLFWFYIGISPASSFVVLAEPVNDHRAFIGYLGLTIPLIVALDYFIKNYFKWATSLILILITTYSIQTFLRAQIWQSNQKIWIDTVEKNKGSVRALNNLAADYIGEGRYLEAQNLLQQCLEKTTSYAMCYINLGVVSASLGFDEQAEKYFSLSVKIDDTRLNSRYRWAIFLSARGFIDRPIQLLEECDRLLESINLDTRLELINLYNKKGALDAAKKLWNETLTKLGPQPDLIFIGKKYGFAHD
ncbi:MAG: tetratricopeptide repeat protein, partial [Bdellovibrionales bacterium]